LLWQCSIEFNIRWFAVIIVGWQWANVPSDINHVAMLQQWYKSVLVG
jgi:hypothetical protein